MQKMKQGDLFQTSFYFFQKNLIWDKRKWSKVLFQYFLIALNLAYNRNKLYKILDYWPRDKLNFSFLEKGLGPSHFVNDF